MEFRAENYFDLKLIKYVGQNPFYEWLHNSLDSGQVVTIEDFKAAFEISDSEFIDLCEEFELTDIYALIL